jgi:hypothetical protein
MSAASSLPVAARTDTQAPPHRATAALLYWLVVVCGLLATSLGGVQEPGALIALWAGTLLGTGFGQVLARGRVRVWLVGLIATNLAWFGFVLMAPYGWSRDLWDSWGVVEVAVMSFVPAVLCGYASLTERGALLAFWFPTALFMVPVLERGGESPWSWQAPHVASQVEAWLLEPWVLLSVLMVLFVAFLHSRETRRIALWRRHAPERLARVRPVAVLRSSPLRGWTHAGFASVTTAAALALTAWLAPHLWQRESLVTFKSYAPAPPLEAHAGVPVIGPLASATSTVVSASAGVATAKPCCVSSRSAEIRRNRFKEYFPVRPHESTTEHDHDDACVLCGPTETVASTATQVHPGAGPATSPSWNATTFSGGGFSATSGSEAKPASPLAPTTAPISSSMAPAAAPRVDSPQLGDTVASSPRASVDPARFEPAGLQSVTEKPMTLVPVTGSTSDAGLLAWLAIVAISGLTLEVLSRPIRRLLALRHLTRGLWPEPSEQRVSNLWHLALVGLRDAGVSALRGEEPEELAARVDLPGIESCALILERARHGVRIEPRDLEVMTEGASQAYHAARGQVGRLARALSWLRWPLT